MAITVRPDKFVDTEQPELWWYGDPAATAFFTVLSLAFPPGERFFIQTLTDVVDQLPPQLADDVRGFARQEANHARQHFAFNRQLAVGGLGTARIAREIEARVAMAHALPPLLGAAFTAGLEHLTAIVARVILRDPRLFAQTSPEIRSFWQWHAIEEIEHKAVAFDVYTALAAGMSPFRRWELRVRAMAVAAMVMVSYAKLAGDLLVEAGHGRRRAGARLLWFLTVRPGLYRQCLPDLLAYLVPGYHPRWVDDTRLLAAAERARPDPVLTQAIADGQYPACS